MFKHTKTGIIFNNRKEACKVMGANRYNRALHNREFIFNYEPTTDEKVITTNFS